jgi:hypothetical protein
MSCMLFMTVYFTESAISRSEEAFHSHANDTAFSFQRLSLECKRIRNGVLYPLDPFVELLAVGVVTGRGGGSSLPPRDGPTPGKVEEMSATPLNAVIRRVKSTPRGCRKKMAWKATTQLRREDKGVRLDPRAPGQGGTYHPAEDGAGAGPAESVWDDQ